MIEARTRGENYRLTNKFNSELKSQKLKDKEKKINNFYRDNDLFKIKNLNEIDKSIFGDQLEEFDDVAREEQIFNDQQNLIEDKIVEEIDHINDQNTK
jgi:hypothetical protein